MKRRGHDNSQAPPRDDWCTPPEVVERLHRMGPVTFDPASNPHSIVRAKRVLYLPKYLGEPAPVGTEGLIFGDGLQVVWDRGPESHNYNNPPYGRGINEAWAAKNRAEGELVEGGSRWMANIVALVPASPETQWFQDYWAAPMVCLVEGRLRFLGADFPADFASALVCWGDGRYVERFYEAFKDLGKMVKR